MRILSLDGGVGSLTYIRLLKRLEELRPGFLSRIDMIVGSSAGAWAGTYLAYLLDQDLKSEEVGEKLIEYMEHLVQSTATSNLGYIKYLLGGNRASVLQEEYFPYMQRATKNASIFDVSRKLSLLTAPMGPPYTPYLQSNWGANAMSSSETLAACAVRSGSMPFWFPAMQGNLDGAFFINNPAMPGLSAIAGQMGLDALNDVVLLSMGADGGTSNLSNEFIPGQSLQGLPSPKPIPPKMAREFPEMPVDFVRSVMNQVRANLKDIMAKLLKIRFDRDNRREEHNETQNWGWKQWIAYPGNLAYILQVLLNGHGYGGAWQCDQFIGERSLRLAPTGLMSLNEGTLMYFLGQVDELFGFSKHVARLWGEDKTSKMYEFNPDLSLTLSWIDYHWMT